MSKQNLEKELQNALQIGYYPLLKEIGFSISKRLNIRYTIHSTVQYVTIERSRWNIPGIIRFNLVLSSAQGDFGSIKKNPSKNELLQKGYPTIQRTISQLASRCHKEYKFTIDTNHSDFSHTICNDFTEFGQPFFKLTEQLPGMITFLKNESEKLGDKRNWMYIGILLSKQHKIEEAKEYFLDAPGEFDAKKKIAEQYGINL